MSMQRFFCLLLFIAMPLVLGGCLGGGGQGAKILNTTPKQDFFRLKVDFDKPGVATDTRELTKFLREFKKLFTKVDDPTLKNGVRRYLALVKNLQAEIDFVKERSKSFDHEKTYAPLKDAYRWCWHILKNDPMDLDTCYLMARTCLNMARFADDKTLEPGERDQLFTTALRQLARIEAVDPEFEASFRLGGSKITLLEVAYLRIEILVTMDRIVQAWRALQDVYYQFSRTHKDAEHIFWKAILDVKTSRFEEAMLTLAEFKTDDHREYLRRNIALCVLEDLYKLRDSYTGESSREDLKILKELRGGRNDAYSKGNYDLVKYLYPPVTSEIRTSLLKAFMSGMAERVAVGFSGLARREELSRDARLDSWFAFFDSVSSAARGREDQTDFDIQKAFEELVALEPDPYTLASIFRITQGVLPSDLPEDPDDKGPRLAWYEVVTDKGVPKSIALELYSPEPLADMVAKPRGGGEGYRLQPQKDPLRLDVDCRALLQALPQGLNIMDIFCRDKGGKVYVRSVILPK